MLREQTLEQLGRLVRWRSDASAFAAGVAWVDDGEMSALNARYKNLVETTDVLAFPAEPEPAELGAGSDPAGVPYWGDVVVCTDQAARQARDLGHSYRFELAVLVLHGLLHLRGFDHTRDSGEMSRLERHLRAPGMRGVRAWI